MHWSTRCFSPIWFCCLSVAVFFTCAFNAFFFLFQEHLHYDVVKSADPELKKATIQINVYKQHRQTIQVIITWLLAKPTICV